MHATPKKPRPLAVPMTRRTLLHAASEAKHAAEESAPALSPRERLAARAGRAAPAERGFAAID